MKYPRVVMLAAMAWLAVANGAYGQSGSDSTARHVIYGEISTLLLWGTLSINYEYLLSDHFSLRIGIGAGYFVEIAEDTHNSVGGMAMVNYFTAGKYKFELGLGVSYALPNIDRLSSTSINPFPAISIGYRHQPRTAGFFFRLGLTYDFRYSGPFQFSWGCTF